MKIEQNFENNDAEKKTGSEEAHNAWVEEMNRKQAVFGNFNMDRVETPINEDDFWEVEPEDESGAENKEVDKNEHLERVAERMDQVKQRRAELSKMINSIEVREEKRELDKELKSLEQEIEKDIQKKEQEKLPVEEGKKQSEHLERVTKRIDQIKERQTELSKMTNSIDVREEKRELEKEMKSLEEEIEKNEVNEKPKDEEVVNDDKEENSHLKNVELRMDKIKQRQSELENIRNSKDKILEKIELEKEMDSLRKEIGEKIDEQTDKNTGENIESKNSEENVKIIVTNIYEKIKFYGDKKDNSWRINFFKKNKLKKIVDDLELLNRTIIFDKMVNINRLKNLSKNKELKELCDSIKNESSIEKVENDDRYKFINY